MAFEDAVKFTLRLDIEGGYVNDPRDPGGETKYGISKRAYPNLNIKDLSLKDAEDIYRRDCWNPIQGDKLPLSLGIAVFDAAVNMGIRRAVSCLQIVLRVAPDGNIGDKTLEAIANSNPHTTYLAFNVSRIKRYTTLTNFDIYGTGWLIRVMKLIEYVSSLKGVE